jgi:hypothetical protein
LIAEQAGNNHLNDGKLRYVQPFEISAPTTDLEKLDEITTTENSDPQARPHAVRTCD